LTIKLISPKEQTFHNRVQNNQYINKNNILGTKFCLVTALASIGNVLCLLMEVMACFGAR